MRIFTETYEALRIAFNAIRANKARGLLTTLGIIIGIMAVVTTMTAANGLGNSFKESISARNRKNLTIKEADKLKMRLKKAVAVNPTTSTGKSIKYRSTIINDIRIVGTTDKHIVVSSSLPEYGRFLTEFDVKFKKQCQVQKTGMCDRCGNQRTLV
jgi:ABC-type lipoprotein release transport system permease subunit